jgi:glucose/mannose-6-phosphate isomerase
MRPQHILDNLQRVRALDRSHMADSLAALPDQIAQSYLETQNLKIPTAYRRARNIVLNGMGGSGLPGELAEALFSDRLKIPFKIINGYQLPATVNQDTLYIISSYSGTTEEPISTLVAAKRRRAKILGITSGGRLGPLMKKNRIPGYIFDAKYNPCGQPRMGLGYSLFGLLGMLSKAGQIKIDNRTMEELLIFLRRFGRQLNVAKETKHNTAKQIAQFFRGHSPVIVASEFLAGNAHLFRNQLHENSKSYANYFILPELNHHLMEGLRFPAEVRPLIRFLLIESALYLPNNRKRYKVTKKVLDRNRLKHLTYRPKSDRKLIQSAEIMLLGGYTSFYLAMLNRIDPAAIPWVDYFKRELKKK